MCVHLFPFVLSSSVRPLSAGWAEKRSKKDTQTDGPVGRRRRRKRRRSVGSNTGAVASHCALGFRLFPFYFAFVGSDLSDVDVVVGDFLGVHLGRTAIPISVWSETFVVIARAVVKWKSIRFVIRRARRSLEQSCVGRIF